MCLMVLRVYEYVDFYGATNFLPYFLFLFLFMSIAPSTLGLASPKEHIESLLCDRVKQERGEGAEVGGG